MKIFMEKNLLNAEKKKRSLTLYQNYSVKVLDRSMLQWEYRYKSFKLHLEPQHK